MSAYAVMIGKIGASTSAAMAARVAALARRSKARVFVWRKGSRITASTRFLDAAKNAIESGRLVGVYDETADEHWIADDIIDATRETAQEHLR